MSTRLSAVLGASVAAAMLLLLGSAMAAPGDLDPTFGDGGLVQTTIGTGAMARAMVLQPDGKIVLAGGTFAPPIGFALARYTPGGALDSGFGDGGVVTGPNTEDQAFAFAVSVAIQPDGKLVAAGYLGDDGFTVVRYTADGTLDTSFGSGGVVKGPGGRAQAVAVQPDGKIVVAGTTLARPNSEEFVVVRFLPDGSLDATFGSGGSARTLIESSAEADAIVLQPDGKIVVAGSSSSMGPTTLRSMALARYEPDGDLDPTFGSGGVVSTHIGPWQAVAAAVALLPDGRIVAVGNANVLAAVAVYLPDGRLDPSFGEGGITTSRIDDLEYVTSVAAASDGSILVAGNGDYDEGYGLARYTAAGRLDRTFGAGGVVTTEIGSSSTALGVAIQSDGKILVAGSSTGTSSTGFALARYRVRLSTTIRASTVAVTFGSEVRISGVLTSAHSGQPVMLAGQDCYSASSGSNATSNSTGEWSASVVPGSRTAYQATTEGDTSPHVTVLVRPRLSISRASGRVRIRAYFGHSLAGERVVLQRYQPATRKWIRFRPALLERIARKGLTVVSGATLAVIRRPGQRLRAVLRQLDAKDCFLKAVSPAIRG